MLDLNNLNIDFMGMRRYMYALSVILIVASFITLAVRGLNLGIDFTGGTLVELSYNESVDLAEVRNAISGSTYSDAVVQYFGSSREIMIRIPLRTELSSAQISNELLDLLRGSGRDVQIHRIDFVGPQVGEDLREGAILATLIAMALILIYVAMRFQLRFSVGANVALLHDPIITIGFFSMLGIEFDLTVLAAILAVIGYSINDTIVIFDRIREVFRKQRKASPTEVMNMAINQTLSRTTMTSWATLLVVIALFFFGGRVIHGFSIALIVGVLVGTYSSIFVASALALDLGVTRKDLMPVEKEGQPVDDLP